MIPGGDVISFVWGGGRVTHVTLSITYRRKVTENLRKTFKVFTKTVGCLTRVYHEDKRPDQRLVWNPNPGWRFPQTLSSGFRGSYSKMSEKSSDSYLLSNFCTFLGPHLSGNVWMFVCTGEGLWCLGEIRGSLGQSLTGLVGVLCSWMWSSEVTSPP